MTDLVDGPTTDHGLDHRVRHATTHATGDAGSPYPAPSFSGTDCPWRYVRFDDGLRCWVPDDMLELWTILGWVPLTETD